jgi:hypothetical protein
LFRRAEPQHKLPSHFFQRTMSRLSRGVGAALVWECCQLQISATNLARSSNRTLTSASDVIRRTMQLLRCSPHPKKPEEEFQTPKSDNFGTAGGYSCQRHRCAPMLAATMRRVVTPSMFLPSSLLLPPIVIRLVQATTRSLSRGDRLQVQSAATIALAWRRGIARPCGRLEFLGMNASVKRSGAPHCWRRWPGWSSPGNRSNWIVMAPPIPKLTLWSVPLREA